MKKITLKDHYTYWYEYKVARHRIDMCLSTTDPEKYCNGIFRYSQKDPGPGKEFVIIKTDNPLLTIEP